MSETCKRDSRIEALAKAAEGFSKIETFTRVIETSSAASLQPMLRPLINDLNSKVAAAMSDLTQIKCDIAEANQKCEYMRVLEDKTATAAEVLERLQGIQDQVKALQTSADKWRNKCFEAQETLAAKEQLLADEASQTYILHCETIAKKDLEIQSMAEKTQYLKYDVEQWQAKHAEVTNSLSQQKEQSISETARIEIVHQDALAQKTQSIQKLAEAVEVQKEEAAKWQSKHAEIETSLEQCVEDSPSKGSIHIEELAKKDQDLTIRQQQCDASDTKIRDLIRDLRHCRQALGASKVKLAEQEAAASIKESKQDDLLAQSLQDYESACTLLRQNRQFYNVHVSDKAKLESDIKRLQQRLKSVRDAHIIELAAKEQRYDDLTSESDANVQNLETYYTEELEELRSLHAAKLSDRDSRYRKLSYHYSRSEQRNFDQAAEAERLCEEHRTAYNELDTNYTTAIKTLEDLRGKLADEQASIQDYRKRLDAFRQFFEWLDSEEPAINAEDEGNYAWYRTQIHQRESDMAAEKAKLEEVRKSLDACKSEMTEVKVTFVQKAANLQKASDAERKRLQIEHDEALHAQKGRLDSHTKSKVSELQKEFKQKLAVKEEELSNKSAAFDKLQSDFDTLHASHEAQKAQICEAHSSSSAQLKEWLRCAQIDLFNAQGFVTSCGGDVEQMRASVAAHEISEGALHLVISKIKQKLSDMSQDNHSSSSDTDVAPHVVRSIQTPEIEIDGNNESVMDCGSFEGIREEQQHRPDSRPTKRKRATDGDTSAAFLNQGPTMQGSTGRDVASEATKLTDIFTTASPAGDDRRSHIAHEAPTTGLISELTGRNTRSDRPSLQLPQSDACTKACEIRALMKPQWPISELEEKILMEQLTSLFSKKAKVSEKLKAIDHYVVGMLNAEPPSPRPCLFALLKRRNGGPGGPRMKSTDCPYCSTKPEWRLCCYTTYADDVASGFGPRVDGRIRDKNWKEKPEPYTKAIDGQEVRFLLYKRADGSE